jgi:arabinose-5-phosphate isomerase
MQTLDVGDILARGQRVLSAEIDALVEIKFGNSFATAVRLIADCLGQVVVTGVGKSGLVAQRIAATLTVTGTRAWFLHPTDAMHGDLAKVCPKDVLLAVSRSGESDDLALLVAQCTMWELPVILITAQQDSALARRVSCILLHPSDEACVHNLTPTSTSTCASVIGDALALVLQEIKGFGPEEFAAFHPNGALGKRLNVTVQEVMVTGDAVGVVAPGESLLTAMVGLARKRGTLAVCMAEEFIGVITAGDVARYVERRGQGWDSEPVSTVMTEDACVTTPQALASVTLNQMQEVGIMAMPVINGDHELVGMVHLHDILRAGVR